MFLFQVADFRQHTAALSRYGHDPACVLQMAWLPRRDVLEQTPYRNQPVVPGLNRVGPARLDVVQERDDDLVRHVIHPQQGGRSLVPLGSERQQELQRVAIAPDRVRRHVPVTGQVVLEERTDEWREEGGFGHPSPSVSKRQPKRW